MTVARSTRSRALHTRMNVSDVMSSAMARLPDNERAKRKTAPEWSTYRPSKSITGSPPSAARRETAFAYAAHLNRTTAHRRLLKWVFIRYSGGERESYSAAQTLFGFSTGPARQGVFTSLPRGIFTPSSCSTPAWSRSICHCVPASQMATCTPGSIIKPLPRNKRAGSGSSSRWWASCAQRVS